MDWANAKVARESPGVPVPPQPQAPTCTYASCSLPDLLYNNPGGTQSRAFSTFAHYVLSVRAGLAYEKPDSSSTPAFQKVLCRTQATQLC